ncbi:GntR family transcriptional regulator [Streptomyces sp. NPDC058665]|uniref:GntR family transcriptional regulator n=1 Tax=Streptomyces sp. NPDC058665 TaxID=3346586 RepID=UPI00366532EB
MSEPAGVYATKSDFAYTRIREGILSGEFEPGAVLQQAGLARTIGISTTPLREALRRLKSEGLVELDAHRDARVASLTAEEARDLLEIRLSLDPLAAALAAERRTKEDIRRIRKLATDVKPLQSNPTTSDLGAHRAFHQAVYRASHNDLLISTLDSLWDKADRYRRLGLEVVRTQEERDQKDHEHHALVDAVARGDGVEAATVMRRHISTSLGARAATRLGAEPGQPVPQLT